MWALSSSPFSPVPVEHFWYISVTTFGGVELWSMNQGAVDSGLSTSGEMQCLKVQQNCEQQPHSFLVTLRTGLQTQFLISRFPLEGRLTILGQHHWRQLTIYLTISPNCFSSFVCNTSQRPISTYLKIELIQSENATRYLTNSQGSFVKDASLMHQKKGKQKIFTTQGWIYFSCSQTLLHKLNLMWFFKYSFDFVIQI